MWKERLKRILVIIFVASLTVLGAMAFDRSLKEKQVKGESIGLPEIPVKETLENVGEEVLGVITKNLPNKLVPEKVKIEEEENESEPIKQPVENIENQTQLLIESLKKLPADQLEAVKKQILKEFCE